MSWQGNECFVEGIEYWSDDPIYSQLTAMETLLWLYGEKGNGWYLLGKMYGDCGKEDDFDPFEPSSYCGGAPSCECWLPNPFMLPEVLAIKVRNPHDLMEVSFECVDSYFDTVAYAGDGNEPLEHMVVYGKEYDMR